VAARARDAALLAQGGGKPPVVTRQEIVPPLETGLRATQEHPAIGTLFPQSWVRQGSAWLRFDKVTGPGWQVILGPDLPDQPRAWRIAPDALVERDGLVAAWFARHGAAAAIVRPDRYVYGVAQDAAQLRRLRTELENLLHSEKDFT